MSIAVLVSFSMDDNQEVLWALVDYLYFPDQNALFGLVEDSL